MLTDNEIKKALECHCHPVCCIDCPMHNREHDNCVTELWLLSFDLINRQQAEIESVNKRADMWHREAELNAAELIKMQAEIEKLKDSRDRWKRNALSFDEASRETEKELEKLYAEVERLKSYIKRCESGEEYWVKCLVKRPEEMLKEFADKVKAQTMLDNAFVDNLKKEMVGDAE